MRLKTSAVLTAGAFAVLAFAEWKWPLRKRVAKQGPRFAKNSSMAATSALVVQWGGGAPAAARRRDAAAPLRTIVAILLLDYSLWWWHRLNHRVPFLWHFHRVHHEDPDLDVSTGIRFHPGEMFLASFFRAAQLRVLHVDERAFTIWQRMLLISILFHHSNLRLPKRVDRALANVIATPRMHGIHHSNVQEDTDSNFASLFSWWDWLHGTMRLDREQAEIMIGAPDA